MRLKITVIVFIFSLSGAAPVFSKSLNVPFTPQAPEANWAQPWQDACEEATIVMVDFFYAGKTFNVRTAKTALLETINTKNKYIGESLDENAETVINIINKFFPWEAKIIKNPALKQIKTEIDAGRPVIIPAHGKHLYNPYFKNGGPDYHSLVISGYDDEKKEFITQEPGTRRGENFRYSYDVIMNAMHDFLLNNTKNGEKIAIFTSPDIYTSANTDGDKDGLNKEEELKYKTNLSLADSDGDGYKDGDEIKNGYSPISKDKKPALIGTLIKAVNDTKVYLLSNGTKRHILNEKVFLSHGWHWINILTVGGVFLDGLETGNVIDY